MKVSVAPPPFRAWGGLHIVSGEAGFQPLREPPHRRLSLGCFFRHLWKPTGGRGTEEEEAFAVLHRSLQVCLIWTT